MNFADHLVNTIQKKQAPVCVGLDTRLDQIPSFILKKARKKYGKTFTAAAEAMVEFNKGIIDAVEGTTAAIKLTPQFFQVFAGEGMEAMQETLRYAKKKGLITIIDSKTTGSGPTAEATAATFLGQVNLFGELTESLEGDAMTVTPLSGLEGIQPYLDKCEHYGKGLFVVIGSSNITARDLQGIKLAGGLFTKHETRWCDKMASIVNDWGRGLRGESGYSSVGAYMGMLGEENERSCLRHFLPHGIFLLTGYGIQGGGPNDVKKFLDESGHGVLVNASRSIIYAYSRHDAKGEAYAEEAEKAVKRMATELQFAQI